MKVVGLTGGVASGKSTVARLLRDEHGVPVIDADQVARDVVAPGTPALARIVEVFGSDAVSSDGRLDRRRMRERVMADPEARRELEAITHPAIRHEIARRLAALAEAGQPVAVVEAALMVETGSWRLYPERLVVVTSPEVQLARLMARDDQDEAGARAVLAAQLPASEKEKVATELIRNDGDLDDLRRQVSEAWARISNARGS